MLPKPQQGRIVRHSQNLDQIRYRTAALTFSKLGGLLKAGDRGNLGDWLGAWEEMLGKDLRLQSVVNTRRLALTGLDWEVTSAAEDQQKPSRRDKPGANRIDSALADDAADYVRETFANLDTFREGLEHLATAIGPNLAVAELVWDGWELAEIAAVPSDRLLIESHQGPNVRIITEEEPRGVEAEPGKAVVHCPGSRPGFPFQGSLARAASFLFLLKHGATSDWATFVEVFGMPVRVGKYSGQATTEEKQEMLDMLKSLASDSYALFSEAMRVEFIESSQRGTSPHAALVEYCDRQISIGFLGGNLTSDTTGGTGTYAAGEVQNEVRGDLLADDILREARTVRRQLIAPLVAYRFAGFDVPLPTFRRVVEEPQDLLADANLIEAVSQRIGLPVARRWVYDQLGIPEPGPNEPIVERLPVSPFEGDGTDAGI